MINNVVSGEGQRHSGIPELPELPSHPGGKAHSCNGIQMDAFGIYKVAYFNGVWGP